MCTKLGVGGESQSYGGLLAGILASGELFGLVKWAWIGITGKARIGVDQLFFGVMNMLPK